MEKSKYFFPSFIQNFTFAITIFSHSHLFTDVTRLFKTLKKRSDFIRVQNSYHKFNQTNFLLKWENKSTNGPILGITVTKKIGNAVIRNKVKRKFKGAFQELMLNPKYYNICKNKNVVIICKKEIRDHLKKSFNNKLEQCLLKM